MQKMKLVLQLISAIILFTHCASIPPEAPQLSQELGKRINAIEKSNIKLLHNYFDLKKKEVDKFIDEEWIPLFAKETFSNSKLQTFWDAIVKNNDAEERLKFLLIVAPQLQLKINQKRSELIQPLEELERRIEQKIQAAYMEARGINNSITSFLFSASKVEENRNRYLSILGVTDESVGNVIDRVNDTVSDLLSKGKDVNEKVNVGIQFIDKIKQIKKELDGGN